MINVLILLKSIVKRIIFLPLVCGIIYVVPTGSGGTPNDHTLPLPETLNVSTGSIVPAYQRFDIPASSFTAVKELSGNNNYYTIRYDTTEKQEIIHADYTPPMKIVKLGYQMPDTITHVHKVAWEWRIITPPRNADEQIKKKNDSGCCVYLFFGDKIRMQILKYVFSETLPVGTTLKKDPFPPMQKMFVIVKNSLNGILPGKWEHVEVDVESDYKRLFASDKCPQLKGIGILTDGDDTKSTVAAEYKNFAMFWMP